ncbi:MAG: metal transporter [Azospirillum brasilense]|nr:MAG: metal transporter [Azospirillum brasilense]
MRTAERLGKANFELEKANAVPDPSVNASVRRLSISDDQAFVVGVSFPLPVLNRNQGNIARARAQLSQAQSETSAAELSLRNDVFEALETMANAYEHAAKFDQSILPSAEKAFALARDGYRRGRFPYLEVLDAQRTLFAVKEQRIATLNEYHKAKAELERMTTPATQPEEKNDAE